MRLGATLAVGCLSRAAPGLPVEAQPACTLGYVEGTTATVLGIMVSESVRSRADDVIE